MIPSSANKDIYNGNGSTSVFAYTFPIHDDDEILVQTYNTSTGAIIVLAKTTDYTVSGVNDVNGGNVTLVDPAADAPTGVKVVLSRNPAFLQETEYTEYDTFPASSHELALDHLVMLCQYLKEITDRSLKLQIGVSSFSSEIEGIPVAGAIPVVNPDVDGFSFASLSTVGSYVFPGGVGLLYQTSSGVSGLGSISGTANEVTVGNSTGAYTISLPSALTFTGKTVTGGTYGSVTLNGTTTFGSTPIIAGNPTFSGTPQFGSFSWTGTYTSSGGTLAGTIAGSPTFSGTVAFSGAPTFTALVINNTGLKIKDTDASHNLSLVPGSDLTADRTLTLTTGDANRTLNISAANVTISSFWAGILDDSDSSAITSAGTPLSAAEGRLTLTTNVPTTTTDVTAATILYYTPAIGNKIPLYDGVSTWTLITFTELSIAVPATTSTMYDVFVYNNAGTATLELTAWTNDTTRATALVRQDGVLVKTGATTRRFVGCIRTTGVSGQTEDSLAKRYCVNYYNQKQRPLRVVEATDTWTYSTASYQQSNANAANQLDFIIPGETNSESLVFAQATSLCLSSTATVRNVKNGIGLDSTTVNSAHLVQKDTCSSGKFACCFAIFNGHIAAGRHTLTWLEYGAGADTQTWRGDDGAGSPTAQCGIVGHIMG